jgi:vitamin B12/bleomycin/antimicrobial peptide transport system ATP-binding/permease protein
MMKHPHDMTSPTPATNAGLVPQLAMMFNALWASPVRNTLGLQAAALFSVVVATAYGQILLNNWNKPFYDALSRHDFAEFLTQLGVFGLIAGCLMILNVAQRWLGEMSKLKLREGLVQDLVHNWMVPGRASRLAHAGSIGVNPDQRMHEDARHLTELSTDLGIGLLQASILLATFISVLWALSSGFAFHIAGRDIAIPGYMVWAALAYSASASLLSYWVGSSLVNRNADHYAREADLRYSLVRVNDHIDAIALAEGEAYETRHIDADLAAVLATMRRLVLGLTNLTWITAGSGWLTLIAPIIAAAPLYFAGKITFGGLMLASGAFMQVQSSLRWFVDNFSTIADWRATLLRVASFRRAVLTAGEPQEAGRVATVEGEAGKIIIDNLAIPSPAGITRLAEKHVEIHTGEHVLIVAESGARKTLVFRTLAGLWPLGSGSLVRPKGEQRMYIPRTAYLPPGTLREVLAYPSTVDEFTTQQFADVLARFGFGRFASQLDSARHWDHVLTEDDQQCLVFARVLLRKPQWLLIDEVLDVLDQATLDRLLDVLVKDLAGTAVIHIGRENTAPKFFNRVLHLTYEGSAAAPTAEELDEA